MAESSATNLLEGKLAIISGASQGIGAACARRLAEEGAKVVLGDVKQEAGEQQAATLRSVGLDADFRPLDVTSERSWQEIVSWAEDEAGQAVSVLVCNAGIIHLVSPYEETRAGWEQVLTVNATGQFLGMKAVLASMKQAGGGSIVHIASTTGLWGSPLQISYSASKGAVIAMAKSASIAVAEDNIRINCVLPGSISTAMTASGDAKVSRVLARTPMGRRGEPNEIAEAVVFLASDRSSYITGAAYNVDGGFMAG